MTAMGHKGEVWRYRLVEFWQSLSAAAKLLIFRLNSEETTLDCGERICFAIFLPPSPSYDARSLALKSQRS
jgi:hypothetical protein